MYGVLESATEVTHAAQMCTEGLNRTTRCMFVCSLLEDIIVSLTNTAGCCRTLPCTSRMTSSMVSSALWPAPASPVSVESFGTPFWRASLDLPLCKAPFSGVLPAPTCLLLLRATIRVCVRSVQSKAANVFGFRCPDVNIEARFTTPGVSVLNRVQLRNKGRLLTQLPRNFGLHSDFGRLRPLCQPSGQGNSPLVRRSEPDIPSNILSS